MSKKLAESLIERAQSVNERMENHFEISGKTKDGQRVYCRVYCGVTDDYCHSPDSVEDLKKQREVKMLLKPEFEEFERKITDKIASLSVE